jgi:GNAT superfamily N-acetyltransferase
MPQSQIDTFVQSEILFPQTFADTEERDWGVLFVTPTIPDSYDGNHACVLNARGDLAPVIDEVVAFYRRRGLPPRVHYMSASRDSPGLRQALRAAGFTFGAGEAMHVYVYQGPSRIRPNPKVHVRQVEVVEPSIFSALTAIGNLRSAKVIERRVRRADTWLFVGEVDGKVASVALLEWLEKICRVDEVATIECHRSKGCARAVIHALVAYYQKHWSAPLYVWTDNPIAGRIYAEAGFTKIDHSITSWVAWLGGSHGS